MNTADIQALLKKQRELCAEYLEDHFSEHPYILDQMVNYAPVPELESVATPEAEIEKLEDRVLSILTNLGQIIQIVKDEWQECNCWSDWDEEQITELVSILRDIYSKRESKAAIKKDEPDLVASDREKLINFLMTIDECYGMHVREDAERCVDNYLASDNNTNQASLASHTCTEGNELSNNKDNH
jgi:hypothetical protein